MRRAARTIAWIASWAGCAPGLPFDTLFSPAPADSSGFSVSTDRETGRDRMRIRLLDRDSMGGGSWTTLDTGLARSNEQGTWSGDLLLSNSWNRDSLDLLWRMWTRFGGLGAPDPSVSDHAWLQQAIARWRLPQWTPIRFSIAGGAAMERQDPGSLSLPLFPGSPPGRFASAALWGGEMAWAREGGDLPADFEASMLEDQGSGRLRLSRKSLQGTVAASLSGDGTDSLRLSASWDSLRLRSLELGSDRSESQRSAGATWDLRAGRQLWTVDGNWSSSSRRDQTGRSQGQDLSGWSLSLDVQGPLGGGWSHRQRLSRSFDDRSWFTPRTGDAQLDSAAAEQDLRDGDRVRTLQLSDTLRFATDRAGGWSVWAGAVQSLRQGRHPWNASPSELDRPNEDLSRRILTLSTSSPAWSPADRPLASWTGLVQQDVFPLAVQSIATNRRGETRFSVDLDPSIADLGNWFGSDSGLLRPVGGFWGREQRNRWRFDTSRTEGLLEEGWWAGCEGGPKSSPRLVARWKRWTTWTGSLQGETFAPDRIQEDWAVDLQASIPLRDTLLQALPWFRHQVERIRAWDGSGWTGVVRALSGRAGMDLSWIRPQGRLRVGAGREWSLPGWNGWLGSLQAEMRW